MNLVFLSQIEANIQVFEMVRDRKIPSIETELKTLAEQKAELADAETHFDRTVAELWDGLSLSPVSVDSLTNQHVGPSVKTAATRVGVRNSSGSNENDPRIAEMAGEKILVEVVPSPKQVNESEQARVLVNTEPIVGEGVEDKWPRTIEGYEKLADQILEKVTTELSEEIADKVLAAD